MDTRPTLLVIAHGSRDPRHAATVSALCARVRALRPGLRVEVGYLDFNAPGCRGCWSACRPRGSETWWRCRSC